MKARRTILHAVALAFAAAIAIYAAAPQTAFGQDPQASMARFGTVEIKNETEYQLFWSLLCRCGCPRETLGTCTCSTAHNMRGELRAELAAGRSVEAIKAAYAEKFGTDAVAVPPNTGSQRAVWLFPLLAIVLGAGLVGVILSRWVRRSASDDAKRAMEPLPKHTAAEDKLDEKYDRRLDDELKALDKE
jgi:cytochrome c-type biogenesis protein CcmH/NrfF